MGIPHITTATSSTIFVDLTPYAIPNTHQNWDRIVELLNDPATTEDDIRPLLDVAKAVATFMKGAIEYKDRAITFNGEPIDTLLTRRIIQHMEAGQEGLADPLVAFMNNVMENPSRRATLGLYEWLEKSGLPITPDGQILAYKIVNEDFTDCHSRTFDNTPGKVVEVQRWQVDEDPDRTCSYGLHFCSAGYLPHFGPSNKKVVILKIHPRDVVSFPRDYGTSKGRCCRYEVLNEVPAETAATFFPAETWVWSGLDEVRHDIEVGQIWRTTEGRFVRIVEDRDDEVAGEALDNNEGGWWAWTGETSGTDMGDLETLCLPYDPDQVAVGTTLVTRDGRAVEVTYVSPHVITIPGSGLWRSSGLNRSGFEGPNDAIAILP